ncbi:MAG: hypothetical protein N2200_07940, partial [Bacteroidia bacterium]|nr:hypothetical protein [Bacteroidia bacterium]
LLRYWGRHPAEEHFWHTVEAIFFPMPHFIQSRLWKKPLEAIQIDITYPQPLGAALRCQTEEFLKKLIHSPHLSH